MKSIKAIILTFFAALSFNAQAEEIGSVDTAFKLLGANHKIVMDVFDDPMVPV